jgi:hypothetical protein
VGWGGGGKLTCGEVVADGVGRLVVATQDSVSRAGLGSTSNSLAALPDSLREVQEVKARGRWTGNVEWELADLTIVPHVGDSIGKGLGRVGNTRGNTISGDVLSVVLGTLVPVYG